jgi:hypothetical protein
MREIRKIALSFLVVAATIALSAGDANAAHKRAHKQAGSSISLDSLSADGFSGRVSSAKQACLDQREVTIYMVNTSSSVPSSVPFGTAVTRSDGSWSLGGWAYPGEYYATVASKKAKRLVCDGATSNNRTWWTNSSGSSG